MEITAEGAEVIAKELYKLSYSIGSAINKVDEMAKVGFQAIYDEKESYETVVLSGTEVISALRQIALRLDRSVLSKI